MCFKEALLLGNASFLPKHAGVSSLRQSASVINVRDAPTVLTSPPVGGRLQVFWQTWASMGASPRVVSILKNGYTLPFQTKPPLAWEPLILSHYATSVRQNRLQELVWSLLAKQAIERVHNPSSQIFTTPSFWFQNQTTDGGHFGSQCSKPVSACKNFQDGNPRVHKVVSSARGMGHIARLQLCLLPHSHKPGFPKISTVPSGRSNSVILSLAIRPLHCSYGVHHCGQGVKLMAQAKGIRLHQYLDDWLIRSQTKESCSYQTQALLTLCQELGWVVNLHKSELDPKQVFDFVGYRYNLNQGVVLPTPQRCKF